MKNGSQTGTITAGKPGTPLNADVNDVTEIDTMIDNGGVSRITEPDINIKMDKNDARSHNEYQDKRQKTSSQKQVTDNDDYSEKFEDVSQGKSHSVFVLESDHSATPLSKNNPNKKVQFGA